MSTGEFGQKWTRVFSFFYWRVRATSMTQRRVENARVHFWTFSPVSVKKIQKIRNSKNFNRGSVYPETFFLKVENFSIMFLIMTVHIKNYINSQFAFIFISTCVFYWLIINTRVREVSQSKSTSFRKVCNVNSGWKLSKILHFQNVWNLAKFIIFSKTLTLAVEPEPEKID